MIKTLRPSFLCGLIIYQISLCAHTLELTPSRQYFLTFAQTEANGIINDRLRKSKWFLPGEENRCGDPFLKQ